MLSPLRFAAGEPCWESHGLGVLDAAVPSISNFKFEICDSQCP